MKAICSGVRRPRHLKTSLSLTRAASYKLSLPGAECRERCSSSHLARERFECTKYRTSLPALRAEQAVSGRASFSSHRTASVQPIVHSIYEEKTGTWQYVVADPSSQHAVIIDPVLDYDPITQVIAFHTPNDLLSMIEEKGYKIDRILETHAHADHLTAASYLQDRLDKQQGYKPPICIGKRIGQVQQLFGEMYGMSAREYENVFDKLFEDDETFDIGNLAATVIHLPGHTPDHVGYKIGENIFCGDSIFHTDIGTARCDFPGGSAMDLFNSAHKLLQLPDHVKIWTGHDYPSDTRKVPVPWMSVKEHKESNMHLRDGVSKEDFVILRQTRDTKLPEPRLLHQSLQINIRGGRLPKPTASGHSLLHLPLKLDNVL